MTFLLKQIFGFLKLLNSENGSNQLAAGIAAGFILGMTPMMSLLTRADALHLRDVDDPDRAVADLAGVETGREGISDGVGLAVVGEDLVGEDLDLRHELEGVLGSWAHLLAPAAPWRRSAPCAPPCRARCG